MTEAAPAELLEPGAGESIRPDFEIKIGRPELVVTETRYAAGQNGPAPHVHHHHADSFWVLEGELAFTLDTEERTLGAGSFVLVPPEVVHTFRNAGPASARFLNIHAPGLGFEKYLRSGFQAEFDQWDAEPGSGRPGSEIIVRGPGEGRRLQLGDSSATIKAGAGDAIGSLALVELDLAPGFPGPVLHRHAQMTDSFYVLEGTLDLQIGERAERAGPDSYAYVPPGNAHAFSSSGPVRALNLMAPGGLERYLEEVAALGEPPSQAQMAEFASRYDFEAL